MRISDWSSDVCSSDLHYRLCRPISTGAATGAMSLVFFFGGNRCDWWFAAEGYCDLDDLAAPPFCNVSCHGELWDKLIDFGRRGIEDETPSVSERARSAKHTSELQSTMRTSYALVCLKQ